MTEEKIICQVCGKEFLYTQNERAFLEDLLKQGKIEEVITPKKCVPCRSAIRRKRGTIPGLHARAVSEARRRMLEETTARTAPSPSPPPPPPPQPPVPGPAPSAPSISEVLDPSSSSPAPHPGGCMCFRCGDQSKYHRPDPNPPVIAILQAFPAPASAPAPAPGTPTAEELVILVASDFEALVCREDVIWRQGNRKIRIRLADIGPEAMKRAMEKGVLSWWKS